MNTTLVHNLRQAEGRYFTDAELVPFESFLQTYRLRRNTYLLLQQKSDALIVASLRKLSKTEPETVRQHSEACYRDMGYVIQSMSLAILKDDEEGFREQLVLWMQNILAALHKEEQSAKAYRFLQETVDEMFPVASAALINQYLSLFIDALTSLAIARA